MNALRDAMNHAALGWVKPELDELLLQARSEAEAFADEGGVAHMQACVALLHQARGTLRMLDLQAPAMVAEELERLAQVLADGQARERDEACGTLMRGIVILPDYLERLQEGHRDIPIVLLPLLNEIRAARGEPGLNEKALLAFDPDATGASESELEHARGSVSGRNRELLSTVGSAVKEELLRIRDALDLHLRTGGQTAALQAQVGDLGNVAETLGMMGLGGARAIVEQQRNALAAIVAGQRPVDEGLLLDIAGALLYVDASLDDQASRLENVAGVEEEAASGELRRTVEALAQEAIANFGKAREDFVAFIETNWNHARLAPVPALLDDVAGALRILQLPEPATLVEGVARYVQVELIGRGRVPGSRQLDTLADAMASLEYYLEALRDRRPGGEEILEIARSSLEALRYWPVPEAPASETGHEASEGDAAPVPAATPEGTPLAHGDTGQAPPFPVVPEPIAVQAPPVQVQPVAPTPVATFDPVLAEQGDFASRHPDIVFDLPPSQEAPASSDAASAVPPPSAIEAGPANPFDPVAAEQDGMAVPADEVPAAVAPDTAASSEALPPAAAAADLANPFDPVAAEQDGMAVPADEVPAAVAPDTAASSEASPSAAAAADSAGSFDPVAAEQAAAFPAAPATTFAISMTYAASPVVAGDAPASPASSVDPASAGDAATAPADAVAAGGDEHHDAAHAAFMAELDEAAARFVPDAAMPTPAVPEPQAPIVQAPVAANTPAVVAAAPVAPVVLLDGGFEESGVDEDIREVFLEEFDEELGNLDVLLPQWRASLGDMERLRPVRRIFHTLKGSGRLVGARLLGEFSWKIEGMLNRVLDGSRPPSPAVLAMVELARQTLPELNAALRGDGRVGADLPGIEAVAERIAAGEEAWYQPPATVAGPEAETLQVPAAPAADDVGSTAGEGTPASVDAVLLEILESEVATHLATVRQWLDRARTAPTPADEALLRAFHTMNGAFAMTDVPEIQAVTGPSEAYLKRALGAGVVPDAVALALLGEAAEAVARTMERLRQPEPTVPFFGELGGRLQALAASLPEAAWPPLPIEPEDEPVSPAAVPGEETGTQASAEAPLSSLDLSAYLDAVPAAAETASVASGADGVAAAAGDDSSGRLAEGEEIAAQDVAIPAPVETEVAQAVHPSSGASGEAPATPPVEAVPEISAPVATGPERSDEVGGAEPLQEAAAAVHEAAAADATAAWPDAPVAGTPDAGPGTSEELPEIAGTAGEATPDAADGDVRAAATGGAGMHTETAPEAPAPVDAVTVDDAAAADVVEDSWLATGAQEDVISEDIPVETGTDEQADATRDAEAPLPHSGTGTEVASASDLPGTVEAAFAAAGASAGTGTEIGVAAESAVPSGQAPEAVAAQDEAEAVSDTEPTVASPGAVAPHADAALDVNPQDGAVDAALVPDTGVQPASSGHDAPPAAEQAPVAPVAASLAADEAAARVPEPEADASAQEYATATGGESDVPAADVSRATDEQPSQTTAAVAASGATDTAPVSAGMAEEDTALDFGEYDRELVDIFVEEGRDLLDTSDRLLAELREHPDDPEGIAGLQRELHTLKGGARMVGIEAIGALAHTTESLLELLAASTARVAAADIRLLERSFDHLNQQLLRTRAHRAVAMPLALIAQLEARAQGQLPQPSVADEEPAVPAAVEPPAPAALPADALGMVPAAGGDGFSPPVPEAATAAGEEGAARATQDQVRVRADLLDNLVNYAGEVAIYRSRLEQQLGAFRGALGELERTNIRLRDQLRRLDLETEAQIVARYQREQDAASQEFDPLELDRFSTLQQLSRALNESAADLGGLQGVLDDLARQYDTLLQQQSRVSSDLQEGLMLTRMVPFDSVVPRLRRVVRQAADEQGKQVQLTLEGTHGELDRSVLDRMVGPLEHMLRNSVAHGIEAPPRRQAAGKAEQGTIALRLRREGSEVVLEVSDDGAGLDRAAIRRRAEQRGLVAADAVLSDAQVDALIFASGLSTSDTVSQLAGRGVGMDVVRNELRQLGGSVDIVSTPGKGTTFVLRLPQTLAVTQAVFVRIGETVFSVPVASVGGIGRIGRDRYSAGEGSYHYGGEEYTLHDLGRLLGLAPARAEGLPQVPLLLVRAGDMRVAVAVDQVLGNREIVVKPVGLQIASIPGVYGATITADGSVVVILDVAPLVRRYLRQPQAPVVEAGTQVEARHVPLVMVVDDSLTMRKVTGRVLERHNLEVATARDGVEALERLEERVPDLMLLDIEMPRMDGYELATAMRADPRYKDVPIVMITSRSGEKHRQRAFDIGVQRYLGKPYQELDLMRNVYDLLGIARVRE